MNVHTKIIKAFGALLLLALLLAVLPAGEAQAETSVTVCAEGCNYTSIQAAIAAVDVGDTVIVKAGTYTDGHATFGYEVNGRHLYLEDGVIIDNAGPCFRIRHSHSHIVAQNPGGARCVANGGYYGIVSELDNDLSPNRAIEDIVIDGLEITGEGLAVSEGGIKFYQPGINDMTVSDVSIVNNFIHDIRYDVTLLHPAVNFGGPVLGALTIQGNRFVGTGGIAYHSGTADARFNYWGAAEVTTGMVKHNWSLESAVIHFSPWCTNAECTEFSPAPDEVYVNADWADSALLDTVDGHFFGYDAFATIQAAVDAVAEGGTVNVADGVYNADGGALAILNKSLTLRGESQAGTILDGSTYGEGSDTTGLGNAFPRAIVVQANNVTVEKMTIRNYQGNGTVGGYAIAAFADTVWGVTESSIDYLTVQDVTFLDTYIGIRAQSIDSALIQRTSYTLDQGASSYAIYIRTSTALVVQGNTSDTGPYWFSDATNATIGGPAPEDGNTVIDAAFNGIWVGQQFVAESSSSGVIQNNTVNGANEGGIVVWNWPGEAAVIKIKDNTVSNVKAGSDPHGGISVYNGIFNNLEVTGNVVTNTIKVPEKPAPPGLKIIANTINGADISENDFSNNAGEGIYLYNVIRSGTIAIERNKIAGNNGAALRLEAGTTTSLDASPNWWGDPAGPAASSILGNVVYNPWYNSAEMTTKTYLVGEGQPYETIQAAIGAASDGDTILVAAGTYEISAGLEVTKKLIITGADKNVTLIKPTTGFANDYMFRAKDGGDLTLSNFTLDGEGFLVYGGVGISASGTGTIDNNIIKNMSYGTYTGVGVTSYGDNAVISNNIFTNIARVGIWAGGKDIVITGNTYTGKGDKDALDYGVEVGQGGQATITGNTISNCLGVASTDNSESAAILVSETYGPGTTAVIEGNTLSNSTMGIAVGYLSTDGSIATASGNNFADNEFHIKAQNADNIDIAAALANNTFDKAFVIDGDFTIYGSIQTAIKAADDGDTIEVAGAVGSHVTINKPGLTLLLKDGTELLGGSPCIIVNADYTRITTESIGGAVCRPTEDADGIEVAEGLTGIIIEGLEIDGTGMSESSHGIDFLGSIEDLYLSDNFIHNMGGDGVHFTAVPAGRVEIKGNLFMNNSGAGVDAPGDVDVTYNAWGHYGGPTAGDGISGNITNYTPWTHADVFVEHMADSSRYANEVAVGEQITFLVKANLQKANGAHLTLTFDSGRLALVSTSIVDTVFTFQPSVTVLANKVTFDGANLSDVSGEGALLFAVTFEGLEATDPTTALAFDAADDVQFTMNPGVGPSLNIFPTALVGITDVNVYDLPTLSIAPLTGFAGANPKEFTLTVTNPATGRAYTDLNVALTVPAGSVLEYHNGTDWVPYVDGVPVGALAADAAAEVLFRVSFPASGGDLQVVADLYDSAIFLVTKTFDFSVASAYTVTASVSMQGRSVFNGVQVTLGGNALFGPYTATSVNLISKNLTFENVGEGGYTFTTLQPRYLNVTADLEKTFNVSAALTLSSLELKGGNAYWMNMKEEGGGLVWDGTYNNVVDSSDAGIVGDQYGTAGSGDNNGDVNFDGKVNILDLSLVGGNYTRTSENVYTGWSPQP